MLITNIKKADLGLYRKANILTTWKVGMAISCLCCVRLFGPTVGGVAILRGWSEALWCVGSECWIIKRRFVDRFWFCDFLCDALMLEEKRRKLMLASTEVELGKKCGFVNDRPLLENLQLSSSPRLFDLAMMTDLLPMLQLSWIAEVYSISNPLPRIQLSSKSSLLSSSSLLS